ncbi:hypothetical protein NEHOM01_1561 [Nematocida homosporus]|uniref:uncharacterized protein n=1 Tax=Nematocida homosporus TaxID=1912981 RepID=UPI002220E614|nr:uncharacterized protein NEHOM01_1561 [Nematocida homosporus]KAI5186575.1 hypothetical protein NEHOM01_1561 [Nematocida homosporus]
MKGTNTNVRLYQIIPLALLMIIVIPPVTCKCRWSCFSTTSTDDYEGRYTLTQQEANYPIPNPNPGRNSSSHSHPNNPTNTTNITNQPNTTNASAHRNQSNRVSIYDNVPESQSSIADNSSLNNQGRSQSDQAITEQQNPLFTCIASDRNEYIKNVCEMIDTEASGIDSIFAEEKCDLTSQSEKTLANERSQDPFVSQANNQDSLNHFGPPPANPNIPSFSNTQKSLATTPQPQTPQPSTQSNWRPKPVPHSKPVRLFRSKSTQSDKPSEDQTNPIPWVGVDCVGLVLKAQETLKSNPPKSECNQSSEDQTNPIPVYTSSTTSLGS